MQKELFLLNTVQLSEIPEICGNGIKVEEIDVLNFDKFLMEFSL